MLFKVLRDGKSCNGGNTQWNFPTKNEDGFWIPGEWMPEIKGNLIRCENGYHLCREKDLIRWLNEEIYEAEYNGEVIELDEKIVVRKVRLLRKIETWNIKTARLFACWCALNTPLHDGRKTGDLFTDEQSKNAVKITERYAIGEATHDELLVAKDTAMIAAQNSLDVVLDSTSIVAWTARITAWITRDVTQSIQDTVWIARNVAQITASITSCNIIQNIGWYPHHTAREVQTKQLLKLLEIR